MIKLTILSPVIGIARCIDEREISFGSVQAILDAIHYNDEVYITILNKRKEIESPDCAICPIKCDRHSNLDIGQYNKLSDEEKALREKIIGFIDDHYQKYKQYIADPKIKLDLLILLMYMGEAGITEQQLIEKWNICRKEIGEEDEIIRR